MSVREHVEFLAGSEHRVAVLETLRDRPSRPCELETALDASRATVQRALTGLTDRGWIHKERGTYRLTAAGALVLRAYDDLLDLVAAVDDAGETLALLDAASVDVPPEAVRTVTVTRATAKTPHAPIERYARLLAETEFDSFRGVSPVVSPVFDEVHRPLVEGGCPIELVVDEETFRAANRQRDDAPLPEDAPFTLYVHPDPIDVGLSLFGDRAVVGAYDDHGRFRASLDGTDEAFVEWCSTLFARHRDAARPVEIA
ncbi:helix-turn-helix transcriptional regulator [Halomarina ordinaria]|uniref:Helix-turn-helix transcriptional regulator n=1 Tax=Halomarina ordinaria TaxID=3033939 RepID=A0ABD5U4Z9_9EURY|nr:transcriptional regulator [Halomarina sp. PSRA2]